MIVGSPTARVNRWCPCWCGLPRTPRGASLEEGSGVIQGEPREGPKRLLPADLMTRWGLLARVGSSALSVEERPLTAGFLLDGFVPKLETKRMPRRIDQLIEGTAAVIDVLLAEFGVAEVAS